MRVCPFCGIATELPHETQLACIDALQAEISRVREMVEKRREPEEPPAHPTLRISGIPQTRDRGANHD
jgi:hypothetical protein